MKKAVLCLTMLFVLLSISSVYAADPIQDMIDMGYMQVKIDNGAALVAFEMQMYKHMTYVQKLGMCGMVVSKYNVTKVYVMQLGNTSNLLCKYDTEGPSFKVYK